MHSISLSVFAAPDLDQLGTFGQRAAFLILHALLSLPEFALSISPIHSGPNRSLGALIGIKTDRWQERSFPLKPRSRGVTPKSAESRVH